MEETKTFQFNPSEELQAELAKYQQIEEARHQSLGKIEYLRGLLARINQQNEPDESGSKE